MIQGYNRRPPKSFTQFVHSKFLVNKIIENETEYNEFSKLFEEFQESLRQQYINRFKILKSYSDKHIAREIFRFEIDRKTAKNWMKYNMFAAIKSCERISELISIFCKYSPNCKQENEISGLLYLLWCMVFDLVVFMDILDSIITGKKHYSGMGKRNIVSTDEIFGSATRFLYQVKIDDTKELTSLLISVFLIRQAIELKLRWILGISLILNEDGSVAKIPGDVFLKWFKLHKSEVILPVPLDILSKIYRWSNYCIHGGLVHNMWQIEWAHYILNPLFMPGSYNKEHSIYGAVKIQKEIFRKINKEIKALLQDKYKKDFIIESLSQPECLLIN